MTNTVQDGCQNCPVHNVGNLRKLGVNMESWDYMIALAGNPNTGKSTVFNAITGLRQHTGNWPGKTVTRAEGGFVYAEKRYKVVDLPGTYSLLSTSNDEEIARNFILFGNPDVTVIVIDATRLERNLNLVLQILEITERAVVCLNLIDEAKRHKININHRILSKELGVPVVPTAARQGIGIKELLTAISEVASGNYICKPHRIESVPKQINQSLNKLVTKIENVFPGLVNARWVALRLLDGDPQIIEAVSSGELGTLRQTSNQEITENSQT